MLPAALRDIRLLHVDNALHIYKSRHGRQPSAARPPKRVVLSEPPPPPLSLAGTKSSILPPIIHYLSYSSVLPMPIGLGIGYA